MENQQRVNRRRRNLPAELKVEIVDCLAMEDAAHFLANVPSRLIIHHCAPRVRRILDQFKMTTQEYRRSLLDDDGIALAAPIIGTAEEGEQMRIRHHNIEWKPQLDGLLLYGKAMTPTRGFGMYNDGRLVGCPDNFVEDLLLHLANSRWTEMALDYARIQFDNAAKFPPILVQLVENKQQYSIGGRILFDSIQLHADKSDGPKVVHIEEGELLENGDDEEEEEDDKMTLLVVNKIHKGNCFEVKLFGSVSEGVHCLVFTKIQPMKEFAETASPHHIVRRGEKQLLADQYFECNPQWDIVLRRGAAFTNFQEFIMGDGAQFEDACSSNYVGKFIRYLGETKHPKHVLKHIHLNLWKQIYNPNFVSSSEGVQLSNITCALYYGQTSGIYTLFIESIQDACCLGIAEGGKLINCDGKEYRILAGHIKEDNGRQYMEFTLANGPSEGAYVFDVVLPFHPNSDKTVRPFNMEAISINRRKNGHEVEEYGKW